MDRTYIFNSDGGTSGGSKLDVTAMLPGMLGGYRGVDPNVLALMNGNGGFGGRGHRAENVPRGEEIHLRALQEKAWNMRKDYIDILIEKADGMKYCDFCRLLSVIYWNLGTE